MEMDPDTQSCMVEGLKRPEAFGHPIGGVEHLHTHISHVLLAGDYAYKLKKPLDLGFLDFSTLERRRHCCEEELRLNRRLAPSVYLEVVPVTGSLESPRFGGSGRVLDYAVRMRRFPQQALLSGRVPPAEVIDRIAAEVADFHGRAQVAGADTPFGAPRQVLSPMLHNFEQVRASLNDPLELARLEPLEQWTRETWSRHRQLLLRRKADGHVRECHGDLHLGNIALDGEQLIIFDGIEFNPGLRWIDTISDTAFLVMDLEHSGEAALARRFLDRYLERGGDFSGLTLLHFYKTYRAMVRAKVEAIRLRQRDLESAERKAIIRDYARYLASAESYTATPGAALVITHGLSGSGKTHASGILVEQLGMVRIRSDVERKRLHGARGSDIYSPAATERTYGRLLELARELLQAGWPVLVDATFLQRERRDGFRRLADNQGVPFLILNCRAAVATLRERILQRGSEGSDVSDADLGVLHQQLTAHDPLGGDERAWALVLDSQSPLPLTEIRSRLSISRPS